MSFEPFVAYGTRKGIVYELNQYGLPNALDTEPYTGLEIYGIRGLQTAQTNVRRISHFNGDAIGLTQIFPTTDVPSGTVTVDGSDLSLKAALGGTKVHTVNGIEIMPMMSDQQGSEPEVGIIVYQAAKKNTGALGYHVQFIPSTQAIPQDGSMGDNNFETIYQLSPSSVGKHLWGPALTMLDDGALTAGVVDGFAPGKPRITAWLADGTEDEFLFDPNLQATVNTYTVWKAVAGVVSEVASGITKATDKITFASAPANHTLIIVLHMVP